MKFKTLTVYVQRIPEGGYKARVIMQGYASHGRVYGANLLKGVNIRPDSESASEEVVSQCARALLGSTDTITFQWQLGLTGAAAYAYPVEVAA